MGSGEHRTGRRAVRWLQALVSVTVVLAIFALILPKIASYSSVWHTISRLSARQLLTLVGATVFNMFAYWWQMQAALPGLTLWQAAVNNQTGTTISNVIPGGGAVALGVVVTMLRSWGFTGSEIGLLIWTTGIWNSFLKLGLPVIAVAFLALSGQATAALLIPALVGLAILVAAIGMFGLVLSNERYARVIGGALGRVWSGLRRVVRKPPVKTWAEGAMQFRRDTLRLVVKRWLPLTMATVLSHLALYFVLLLALRFVGVHGYEITWAQVLAVFAFARLLSAAPITPGGVGVVELALIAGLYAAGRAHAAVPLAAFKVEIAAATLLFRTLTFGLQIPLGGFTYIMWRRTARWRKSPPDASGRSLEQVRGSAE
jgi:uncharacterized membrane protein YbhN (UPF0104 family)